MLSNNRFFTLEGFYFQEKNESYIFIRKKSLLWYSFDKNTNVNFVRLICDREFALRGIYFQEVLIMEKIILQIIFNITKQDSNYFLSC